MSKHAERISKPRPSRGATAALVLALSSAALAVGCNVAIGGGVLVAGVVAGVLTYDCGEGVGVTLWDRATAHSVCDASVVAKQGNKTVTFSPCYSAFLDEGSWSVIATKPGYQAAVGSVVVPHEHRCSEPSYHSVELTLLREGEGPRADEIKPAASSSAPPVLSPPPLSPSSPPSPPSLVDPVHEAPVLGPETSAPPAGAPPSPQTR
jgi:hypothetical protein